MVSKRLGILISGRGSNMESILKAIQNGQLIAEAGVVISNRSDALGLEKARLFGVQTVVIDDRHFSSKDSYETELVRCLMEHQVDWVVLAGYMKLLGPTVLSAFDRKILNIHPSLLPAFKGLNAQTQALEYGVKWSGCTVHLVSEGMDDGPIILQAVVPVLSTDTSESLSERILEQEHIIYSQAIQLAVDGALLVEGRIVHH